jgi:hypothetical protein
MLRYRTSVSHLAEKVERKFFNSRLKGLDGLVLVDQPGRFILEYEQKLVESTFDMYTQYIP